MFYLPKKRWQIHVLIIANAIIGCISGMILMSYWHIQRQHKMNNDHSNIMELCLQPKVKTRIEILAITGKPVDESDEMVVKGVCNMVMGQIVAHEMGLNLE
jgi:hypothetical protein